MHEDADEFDPNECAGGLCPPRALPAQYRKFDRCVWSRAPGEIWWRRRAYILPDDTTTLAMYEGHEPDTEFRVRGNDDGPPPGEDD